MAMIPFQKHNDIFSREEEKASEKVLLNRVLSRAKEKLEEELEQQSESKQFRASEVPKHVYEPIFQTMLEQYPNR